MDPQPEPTPADVAPPSIAGLVASAVATWRAALVEAAGGSALVDVDLRGEGPLDLSAAHPSGIAQLFAGRDTRLSNLVREGAALSTAKRRARAVGSRSDEYAQRYGVAPTYLAIGVATWTERTSPDVPAPLPGGRRRPRPREEAEQCAPRRGQAVRTVRYESALRASPGSNPRCLHDRVITRVPQG